VIQVPNVAVDIRICALVTRPGKAIGNGHPVAAVLGAEVLREAAGSFFVTGTFWFSAVPMVAALASIALLEEHDGVTNMFARGNRLVSGLREQAAS
jgi:glutamate-1-semialdehyde 2,1-aminomutase